MPFIDNFGIHMVDEWHDWVRFIVFYLNAYCLVVLIRKYRKLNDDWNRKTLDYWYALFMWCAAGCVLTAQGIILDRPFTPAVVMVTAASIISAKGLRRTGSWGGSD